jgi:hypothetical protein
LLGHMWILTLCSRRAMQCVALIMATLKRMRWEEHAARLGRRGMHIGYLCGRPLRRLRRRWADNIKMDFREMRCVGMN